MKRAVNTDTNPQGKGLVPVLNEVASSRAKVNVPPKKIDQIAGELFTSLFVLESEFTFRPVIGRKYNLYRKDGCFRLSPVGPDQWSRILSGQFIETCVLERDVTWTLEMDEYAAKDERLHHLIQEKKQVFEETLESAGQLGDILPVYYESLPYYQRLFASALANSLGISMQMSGIKELTYREAKGPIGDRS